MDIILSIAGVAIFILILPFVAIAIKLDSKGPIFFKARRVSADRTITILKFRTMVNGADGMKNRLSHLNERTDGPFFKITKDPRITKVGRTLRKLWLDETPQILSVLKGDISLVGPRPYEPEEIKNYPSEFQFLKNEKAGLTGFSQIKGSSNLPFRDVLKYDAYYARHKSLTLDLKILWKTFLLLFHPSGV